MTLTIFHYALNPNGFLMLGSSEGIGCWGEGKCAAVVDPGLGTKQSVVIVRDRVPEQRLRGLAGRSGREGGKAGRRVGSRVL